MTDDSIITVRLRQLAEGTNDELDDLADTAVLDETDMMATGELRQILDPAAELSHKIHDDLRALGDSDDSDDEAE